jgi:D-alanyl-lipoteichoic acid acyltransferase DltB (MBOAT superfamily)
MLFNSLQFLVFFIITTSLFFLLKHQYRWLLLLLASSYFYMVFKPIYIFILAFTIVIDYFAGIAIEKQEKQHNKKLLLILSLVANLGILIVFKYWNFLAENLNFFIGSEKNESAIPLLHILLPIGLSFHTFQAMSYTIEVYRGRQKAEKHFGIYALYVMFYPQLVAGPIERPQNMLHQFHKKMNFSYANFKTGFILICIGLFKKIFIADRLGSYVDAYYNNLDYLSFIPSVSAAIFYSLQIYCDFSGYSSIAIGTAKCMGFNLMKNFNAPYQASSITDFWRRWHISLSTWFRDYVYIPLGGNKGSKSTTIRNISIVFLLSGVWHGANWTFIVWGAIHACLLILEQLFFGKKINTIQPTIWKKLLVFSLVTLAWIFFRSKDFNQAFQVLKHIFSFQFNLEINQISAFISPLNMLLCWICIPLLFLIDNIKFSTYRKHLLAFLLAGTLLTITLGKSNETAFIYFQF